MIVGGPPQDPSVQKPPGLVQVPHKGLQQTSPGAHCVLPHCSPFGGGRVGLVTVQGREGLKLRRLQTSLAGSVGPLLPLTHFPSLQHLQPERPHSTREGFLPAQHFLGHLVEGRLPLIHI